MNTGRRLSFALLAFLLQTRAADAAPGDIDTTFGQGGFAHVGFADVGRNYSEALAVARDANNRLVVVGLARAQGGVFTDGSIVIARFNANGTLDPTFGQDGRTRIDADTFSVGSGVAIQGDGKIVVAGYAAPDTSGASMRRMILFRFNPNGLADSTFGAGGMTSVEIGSGGQITAMRLQPDGRIVVAGQVFHASGGNGDFYVARYRTNGTPDTSFGATGNFPNLTASVRIDFGGRDSASDLAIQSDGRIVLVGTTEAKGGNAFAVARLSAGGLLDSTFGTGGRVTTSFVDGDTGSGGDRAHAVALQNDGRIVVAGQAEMHANIDRNDFALARYNSNGSLDTSFSGDGKVTTDFGLATNASDTAFAMLIEPNGRIVAVGYAGYTGGDTRLGLARYDANGSLDTTFGSGGTVAVADVRARIARATVLQMVGSSGQIVVAGVGSPPNGTSRMMLARFAAFTQVQLQLPRRN